MDETQFDALTRLLSGGITRHGIMRLLAGLSLGGLLAVGPVGSDARKGGKGKDKNRRKKKCKKKKVTICHQGQTITVSKCALKGHQQHGDTVGPCPCRDLEVPCTADAQCCSGICDSYFDVCKAVRVGCDPNIAGQCPNQGICCDLLQSGDFVCIDNPLTNAKACGTQCNNLVNCQNSGSAAQCQSGLCCCQDASCNPPLPLCM